LFKELSLRRKIFGTVNFAHRFHLVMTRVGPYAAAAGAVLILWHAARDRPESPVSSPALISPYAAAAGGAASPGPASSPSPPSINAPVVMQQASLASTIEVIVGRNDTMDAIFRRMSLDKSDLAAIRNLPGIRQSIDFLKPGDAIRLTHLNSGAIKELWRKVSETQTLSVVRQDDGFAARLISNPVQTRIRTAAATIDSSLFQAAETAHVSDMSR
jgi:hypothetical protein